MILADLQNWYYVELDDPKRLHHRIDFHLPGWYSLCDDGVYREGEFATYSRIRIHGPGKAATVQA